MVLTYARQAAPPMTATRVLISDSGVPGNTRKRPAHTAHSVDEYPTMPKLTSREWQALADHVAPYPHDPDQPSAFVSTLNAALRDARVTCGRDADSGKSLSEKPKALWAGTLVYFALLDQIGDTLRPALGRDIRGEASIERALRQFGPGTTLRQRQALYALRNAFAHEFGLVNVNTRRPEYTFVFAVDDDPSAPLIRWPARRWDGDLSNASVRTRTLVSLPAFGDLCERVVLSVRQQSSSVRLRSRVPVDELQRRFAFKIADGPS